MLFDLRGRHRRRAVKFTYVGLALLIGGGLSFASQIKKYEKQIKAQPSNVAAWEKLTAAQLHESGGEAFENATTGAPTAKGKELFTQASHSWESYIALNPPKPSLELAKLMLRVYGAEGLNQPASAVQVLQLVVAAEPKNASYYAALAEYAYKAKNIRVGDLASGKAVSLAPPKERARVKTELEGVKKAPEGGALTTTTNGTTYTGKPNSKGGFVGTAVKTTPQPAKGTTTKTSTAKSK